MFNYKQYVIKMVLNIQGADECTKCTCMRKGVE